MTTGYDCEDLLNIILLRPIFSPTDFIQVKGRGTRKYTFRYAEKEAGQVEDHRKQKEKFKLFDFFAVCEYFEEKFNYDEIIELPPIKGGDTGGGGGGGQPDDDFTNVKPDPLAEYIEKPVPVYGIGGVHGKDTQSDRYRQRDSHYRHGARGAGLHLPDRHRQTQGAQQVGPRYPELDEEPQYHRVPWHMGTVEQPEV